MFKIRPAHSHFIENYRQKILANMNPRGLNFGGAFFVVYFDEYWFVQISYCFCDIKLALLFHNCM
jgi:uncharacterized membrane protein YesL